MKSALFLLLLLFTASTFTETLAAQEREYPYKDLVQTAQINKEEVALIRELHEWNGPFTQEDDRHYVQEAGFKGGYNMGPNSKYGIMKGMAKPMQGHGGLKWGPCNRSMLSDSFVNGWIRTPGGRYRNPAYMVKPGGVACAKL
ncbi:hypothetical protein [Bradyrhizobium jicamae]|uniref:hypothetical protein n=1 Tax=Bradyrhizobium jicamae TaxID=280332 RepID=UPI000B33676C|nr:hypothetical protein [Bradyrhizobium jicamae]